MDTFSGSTYGEAHVAALVPTSQYSQMTVIESIRHQGEVEPSAGFGFRQ